MKVLCHCWRKSDICPACYMANVEDWDQIHAIAMSAEAQRRLEEDLRFLESINVWHLVNLRSNPSPSLYGYGERLDSLTMGGPTTYSHQPYQNTHPSYLHGNQYSQPVSLIEMGSNHHQQQNIGNGTLASGYGTSLPYPDLIIHTRELPPQLQSYHHPHQQKGGMLTPPLNNLGTTTTLTVNGKQYAEEMKKDSLIADDYRDFAPVIQNGSLTLQENPRLKHLSLLPKEPDDYDTEQFGNPNDLDDEDRLTPDGRKTVKFTPDTVFVERDMDSPFWKAFSERRRLRRINRQRKQLNAQIAQASYQPSIVEIVKTAFGKSSSSANSNNNNNNNNHEKVHHEKSSSKKKPTKSEVLVYDNSSQIPAEKFTAHYVYTAPVQQPKRTSKLMQMITCQCLTSSQSS